MKQEKNLEKACFGAGCFWHVQKSFGEIKGVVKTTDGFMGGISKDPSYRDVCSHKTGHAEVCLVEFDPEKVSYRELLELFWQIHNPTQLNRQGPDIGDQYRSVIFYYDERQKRTALESRGKEQKKYKTPIATEIMPEKIFYRAEEYHQEYLKKNKLAACAIQTMEAIIGKRKVR
jgi:peptide-methionine (S)-S-oxide reductase